MKHTSIYITYSWPYITTACFWHVIVTAEVYLHGMSMLKQFKHFRTFLKIFIPSIQNHNFYFCTNYMQLKYGNTETWWSKAAIISHIVSAFSWYLSENSDFSTCYNHVLRGNDSSGHRLHDISRSGRKGEVWSLVLHTDGAMWMRTGRLTLFNLYPSLQPYLWLCVTSWWWLRWCGDVC